METHDHGPALRVGQDAPAFEARPVSGLPVRVPRAGRVQALVFVPYLGSPVARQILFDLQDAFAHFDRAGVGVAAVSPSTLCVARDFVPRHHLLYPLIADEQGEIGRQWHIGQDRWLLCTVKGLRRVSLRRAARSFRHGHGSIDGPPRQLGAEFVVDAAGKLVYASYACSLLSMPDLDTILRCATSC